MINTTLLIDSYIMIERDSLKVSSALAVPQ